MCSQPLYNRAPFIARYSTGTHFEKIWEQWDANNFGASVTQCLINGLEAQKTKLKYQDFIIHKAGDNDQTLNLSGSHLVPGDHGTY